MIKIDNWFPSPPLSKYPLSFQRIDYQETNYSIWRSGYLDIPQVNSMRFASVICRVAYREPATKWGIGNRRQPSAYCARVIGATWKSEEGVRSENGGRGEIIESIELECDLFYFAPKGVCLEFECDGEVIQGFGNACNGCSRSCNFIKKWLEGWWWSTLHKDWLPLCFEIVDGCCRVIL
jgi:hypothetical protein